MRPIRSFVIRIYRQGKHGLDGVVEDVGTGRSIAFHSSDELWQALRLRRRSVAKPVVDPPPIPLSSDCTPSE